MEQTSITVCSSGSWLTENASIAMMRGMKCRRLPSLPILSATSCTASALSACSTGPSSTRLSPLQTAPVRCRSAIRTILASPCALSTCEVIERYAGLTVQLHCVLPQVLRCTLISVPFTQYAASSLGTKRARDVLAQRLQAFRQQQRRIISPSQVSETCCFRSCLQTAAAISLHVGSMYIS